MSAAVKSSDEGKILPPYVAYKTFAAFIEGLKKTGIPSRIDRSVMSSLSGTAQSQLAATLRIFNLVSDSGHPEERLSTLVNNDMPEKKKVLKEMLEEAYPYIFAGSLDIKTATTKQVEEEFAKQGASGETIRKCLAFFLAAVKQAEIKISAHIKPGSRSRSNGNRTRKSVAIQPEPQPPAEPKPLSTSGHPKVIQLKGGTLTLSFDVNILEMDEGDRKFVFGLIDQIQAYQRNAEIPKPQPPNESTDEV